MYRVLPSRLTSTPALSAIAGAMPRWLRYAGMFLAAVLLFAGAAVLAATAHRVTQKNRSFSIRNITIAAGDSIAFDNEDEFLHQIYVDSRDMDFDSAEQHPGQVITVQFPVAGTFRVRCHIHPKMLLTVTVQ
jgi:plastocyanin